MLLKEYLEAIQYKITDGTDYGWNCYGTNTRYLDSVQDDRYSISALFDSTNQFVYAIELWDYANNREYRWQHPDYKESFLEEAKEKGIDPKESLDGSKFIDLDVAEDILEKISAVVNGEEYDSRIQVPLTLPDNELFQLMKLAHENDITLNQFVEGVLKEAIDNAEMLKDWK
jgi:predicted HicB family RNase H-like nuclease